MIQNSSNTAPVIPPKVMNNSNAAFQLTKNKARSINMIQKTMVALNNSEDIVKDLR
jgi:hypothetical protein